MRATISPILCSSFLLVVLTGCSLSARPANSNSPVAENISQKIAMLAPGDVVAVRTKDGESYDLTINRVGEDFLEGEARSWDSGAQWWPVRVDFESIRSLDGITASGNETFEDEASSSEESGRDRSRNGNVDNATEVVPDNQQPSIDRQYDDFLANFTPGEVVAVTMHSGETIKLKITDIGPDYLRGIRVDSLISWEDNFPENYDLANVRSIDGNYVPVDLAQFRVGDRVELETATGGTVRMEIFRIAPDRLSGKLLDGVKSSRENRERYEIARDEIRSAKLYVPTSRKVATVLEYVGKGILVVVGVAALAAIALMFALAGVPPPFFFP